jgi:hypothetical protein
VSSIPDPIAKAYQQYRAGGPNVTPREVRDIIESDHDISARLGNYIGFNDAADCPAIALLLTLEIEGARFRFDLGIEDVSGVLSTR